MTNYNVVDDAVLEAMLSEIDPIQQDLVAITETPMDGQVNLSSQALSKADHDNLMLENLATVKFLARRIHARLPQHVELEDLVSAGVVGLIDAIGKFNHNKNVPFKSYAQFRIRGAILDSLRLMDWSPRDLRPKGRAMKEATHALTQKLGREPEEAEVAAEMKIDLAEYHQIVTDLRGLEIGSLNMLRTEESGEEELAYVPGPLADDPLLRCLQGESKQRLMDAIDTLPDRERMVISLYYYEEMTMKEIGQVIGVVESRVSQINSAAVLRLRAALDVSRHSPVKLLQRNHSLRAASVPPPRPLR